MMMIIIIIKIAYAKCNNETGIIARIVEFMRN